MAQNTEFGTSSWLVAWYLPGSTIQVHGLVASFLKKAINCNTKVIRFPLCSVKENGNGG